LTIFGTAMPVTLPITDPVLIVAIAMAIFLVAPFLFERMRVPGIIGVIVAGAVIGPTGLGVLARDATIVLLGTVGILYLVFLAGLELDLHRFVRFRRRSIVFGLISFSIPMTLGTLVMPLLGFDWAAAILIGSIIGSHTLLAYPIVSRLGLVKNAAVTTVVGGTLVTDTLALGVLAVVAGSIGGAISVGFFLQLFGVLGLYVAAVLVGVPRLGRWFFRNAAGNASAEFIFLLTVLFGAAWLAEVAGAQPIIGAFLAGLTLNRLIPNESPLMNRVRFVGNAIFIPFFLLSVGMLVDPRVLVESFDVWIIAGALIAMVSVGKYAGAWATERIFGYTREERVVMFGLSVPQAAATLAVTFVGLEIGLFGETVVNAVIVMILVTGLLGPSLVERFGRALALQEEQKPYDPAEAPQRILVPMANPATAEDLMNLALLIREPDSPEPIYPLTVVPADEDRSGEFVATAEKMLSHAASYAAGADVPVVPLTRVDHNFANGIARGITENRASTVIIGWDGKRANRRGIFGSVLDQLLEQTKQQVLVTKVGHPFNTTARIVVLIPQGADHTPGFLEAVRTVKQMANSLGAVILGYTVGAPARVYQAHLDSVKPEAPTTLERAADWDDTLRMLTAELRADDLVVVLSARRGTIAWDPGLERLPGQLASLVPESFIMMYPSETIPSVGPMPSGGGLPRTLIPERILTDVPSRPYAEVIHDLLRTHFASDPDRLAAIERRVLRVVNAFAPEIQPGVIVPHARIPELRETVVFLATSREGIRFPGATQPAELVFVVLTPEDQPQEHLMRLAEIARLVADPEGRERLLSLGAQTDDGAAGEAELRTAVSPGDGDGRG
jgi:Kef-type K+ transport system membrane component KefB/mannitol/fructose-specific phosphotransferase system IIA component (Ntr-type)/nucleotide-binding universal stress UspA family protein